MQDILNNAKELACKLESYDSITDDLLASASKIIKASDNNQEVGLHFVSHYRIQLKRVFSSPSSSSITKA
jgi:hypothetical protein